MYVNFFLQRLYIVQPYDNFGMKGWLALFLFLQPFLQVKTSSRFSFVRIMKWNDETILIYQISELGIIGPKFGKRLLRGNNIFLSYLLGFNTLYCTQCVLYKNLFQWLDQIEHLASLKFSSKNSYLFLVISKSV